MTGRRYKYKTAMDHSRVEQERQNKLRNEAEVATMLRKYVKDRGLYADVIDWLSEQHFGMKFDEALERPLPAPPGARSER